jgi:hypothetical protein
VAREARRRVSEESDADADEVRWELGALSTLGFFTRPGDPTHASARKLDAGLVPVRARARAALVRHSTPAEARDALRECWALADTAAKTIDTADWLLGPGGTRGWGQRHIEHVASHAQKRRPSA